MNDEAKAGTVLMEMMDMQKAKKNKFLKGRDYEVENVEKAGVWPEVYLENISLRGYGKEIETRMVVKRREENEKEYVKKREEY